MEKDRSIQDANLRPLNTLSKEERSKIASLGGKARVKQKIEQKNLRETALTLLNTPISKDQAKKFIGDDADLIEDKDLTMQSVLTVRAMRALLDDGNIKAYETLRDTSGQKPKEEIQIDGKVIMTDADRRLIDNLKRRLER